jgi:hypothetical protein
MRLHAASAALLAALVVAAPAAAWKPVAPGAADGPVLGLRTKTGTELLVWVSAASGDVVASRGGGSTIVVRPRDVSPVFPVALVQQPDGRILLYVATVNATLRTSSADDGRTWTAQVRTALPPNASITSAAVRPDGTPVFAGAFRDEATDLWFLGVFQGVDAERQWRGPLGMLGSVVVGRADRAFLVYWSDERVIVPGRPSGTFWRAIGRDGIPEGATHTLAKHDASAFVVHGRRGTAVAVVPHRLTLRVVNLQTGAHATRRLPNFFGGRTVAPVQDVRGRIWVVWQDGGTVFSAREDRIGSAFRRGGRADYPFTGAGHSTARSIVPFARSDGSVHVFADVDGRILRQRLRLVRR